MAELFQILHEARPDIAQTTLPAPLPSLVEYRRMLSSSETWEFSFFNWVIENVQVVGDMIYVRNMTFNTFNGNSITVPDVGVQQGRNVRLIFERSPSARMLVTSFSVV